eukprot:jgi/Bigna1/75258/fgenesh1_pg.33_\
MCSILLLVAAFPVLLYHWWENEQSQTRQRLHDFSLSGRTAERSLASSLCPTLIQDKCYPIARRGLSRHLSFSSSGLSPGHPPILRANSARSSFDTGRRYWSPRRGGNRAPDRRSYNSSDRNPQRKTQKPNDNTDVLEPQLWTSSVPLRCFVFIDGTWLYYSLIKRFLPEQYGIDWENNFVINWSLLPRAIATRLQARIATSSARSVDVERVFVFGSLSDTDAQRTRFFNDLQSQNFQMTMFQSRKLQEKLQESQVSDFLYIWIEDILPDLMEPRENINNIENQERELEIAGTITHYLEKSSGQMSSRDMGRILKHHNMDKFDMFDDHVDEYAFLIALKENSAHSSEIGDEEQREGQGSSVREEEGSGRVAGLFRDFSQLTLDFGEIGEEEGEEKEEGRGLREPIEHDAAIDNMSDSELTAWNDLKHSRGGDDDEDEEEEEEDEGEEYRRHQRLSPGSSKSLQEDRDIREREDGDKDVLNEHELFLPDDLTAGPADDEVDTLFMGGHLSRREDDADAAVASSASPSDHTPPAKVDDYNHLLFYEDDLEEDPLFVGETADDDILGQFDFFEDDSLLDNTVEDGVSHGIDLAAIEKGLMEEEYQPPITISPLSSSPGMGSREDSFSDIRDSFVEEAPFNMNAVDSLGHSQKIIARQSITEEEGDGDSTSVAANPTAEEGNSKIIDPTKDYSGMKVAELKSILQEKGLKVSGNKAALIERLQRHADGS